jgi:hypothetical protein
VCVRLGYTSRVRAGTGVEEIIVVDTTVWVGLVVDGVFAGGSEVCYCGMGLCRWGGVQGLRAEAEGEDSR